MGDPKSCYVYLLESTGGSTYIGATVDLEHRLRQHNKEIKGGAVATSIKVARGEVWRRVCYVVNFPDWTAALQFEWRFKQLSRKLSLNEKPIVRRLKALKQLLSLTQSTTKAIPFSDWALMPEIKWEDEFEKTIYENLDH
jgi:structure-specific endonuclease subunit SLX1